MGKEAAQISIFIDSSTLNEEKVQGHVKVTSRHEGIVLMERKCWKESHLFCFSLTKVILCRTPVIDQTSLQFIKDRCYFQSGIISCRKLSDYVGSPLNSRDIFGLQTRTYFAFIYLNNFHFLAKMAY